MILIGNFSQDQFWSQEGSEKGDYFYDVTEMVYDSSEELQVFGIHDENFSNDDVTILVIPQNVLILNESKEELKLPQGIGKVFPKIETLKVMIKLTSITHQDLETLGELKNLHLNSTAMKELTAEAFLPLKNLTTLNLDDNIFEKIDASAFSCLEKLGKLSLQRAGPFNEVFEMSSAAMRQQTSLFIAKKLDFAHQFRKQMNSK